MAPPVKPPSRKFLIDKDQKQPSVEGVIRPSQFRKRPSFHFAANTAKKRAKSSSDIANDEDELQDDGPSRDASFVEPAGLQWPAVDSASKSLIAAVQDADLIASFDSVQNDTEGATNSNKGKDTAVGTPNLTLRNSPGHSHHASAMDNDLSPSSKRMRFSAQRHTANSSPEQTRGTGLGTQFPYKFLSSLARVETQSDDPDQSVSRRQAFLRPPSSQADKLDIDPHLIQFSPHRKGKIYEPGGLAATMQSHLMDMTSSGSFALPDAEQRPWIVTVTACEASIPFVLAVGRTEDNQSGRFILPGSKVVPVVGDVVRVQGMTWTCELEDGPWQVCVDWRVVK